MQRPDERKRRDIMTVATRLFATRSFHEVRLEDVAAAARVGKATVYVYFESKEALFLTLIREGFERLVAEVRRDMEHRPEPGAWTALERIVHRVVEFATGFPHLFQLMRSGAIPADDEALQRHRCELAGLIERTIRRGVRAGELTDAHPALTSQFVLSFVRGVLLYGPPVAPGTLRSHMLAVLAGGIRTPLRTAAPRRSGVRGRRSVPAATKPGAAGRRRSA